MENPKFFAIPKQNAVYKVQEGCCYEKVVYDGPEIGVCAKNDQPEDDFNSSDLICYDCNSRIKIIPIDKAEYDYKLKEVNRKRSAA